MFVVHSDYKFLSKRLIEDAYLTEKKPHIKIPDSTLGVTFATNLRKPVYLVKTREIDENNHCLFSTVGVSSTRTHTVSTLRVFGSNG
jgi:hypothetical protein